MREAGWLQEVADSRFPSESYGLSEAGRTAAEGVREPKLPKQTMKAEDVLDLLRQRHRAPAWFLGTNVSVGGSDADAVAMLTHDNFRTVGYEIKVSRGDFRRELKSWRKNARLRALVDEFYFVVPAGMVAKDEVPLPDGLMYATGERVRIVRRYRREAFGTPTTVERRLAASLLRRKGRDERQAIWAANRLADVLLGIRKQHPEAFRDYEDWVKPIINTARNLFAEALKAGVMDGQMRT